MKHTVKTGEHTLTLTNTEKVLWPESGLTKAHLIQYYGDVSSYLLPHLKDRPFVMSRYPDGIHGKHFYQKNKPEYTPGWMDTFSMFSGSGGRIIEYIVCNSLAALMWIANQVCIEMHPWLSTVNSPRCPDIAVFDIDPMPPRGFKEAVQVAVMVNHALCEFGIRGYPKTSGSTGMHVFVPVQPRYSYGQTSGFVRFIFALINRAAPQKTTLERSVDKRTGRVYLDYLQNGFGKTMAWQYSLRPDTGAPVSMPLTWDEVEDISDPADYNMLNVPSLLKDRKDLYCEMNKKRQSIDHVLKYV